MRSVLLCFIILTLLGCVENGKKTKTVSEKQSSQTVPDTHSSQNSLDWAGTYSCTLPCASCPGIEMTLTLYQDRSYTMTTAYLDKNSPNSIDNKGNFRWNEAGNTITLENEEAPNQYFVGENYIAKLDSNGERVTGDLADMYILKKD